MPFRKGQSGNPGRQFQPGQSGNPKGYPPGRPNRSTSARRWLAEGYTYAHPVTGQAERGTLEDAATIAQVRKALDGDTGAYRELMDAAYGKKPAVLTGPDDGCIPVQVASGLLNGLTLEQKKLLLELRRKLRAGLAADAQPPASPRQLPSCGS